MLSLKDSTQLTHKPITKIPESDWSAQRRFLQENFISANCAEYCLPEDWQSWIQDFTPGIPSLQELHRSMIATIPEELRGKFRLSGANAGEYRFTDANNIVRALTASFTRERNTPSDVFAWLIDAIGWIHPFIDGNRRTLWGYTNLWLMSLGYIPINWEKYRPTWEQTKSPSGNDRLVSIIKSYIEM